MATNAPDANQQQQQRQQQPPPPPARSQEAAVPDREQLMKIIAAQQQVAKVQSYAKSLRDKASTASDPKERERLLKEAYDKEVEAHGNSKLARRIQSGPWQGLAAGSGIGLGTGLGIGAVVGTLVGGLVSIPTTGLGALIGTGVGAINGPFIKVGGKEKRWEEASPEEVVDALEQEQAQSTTSPEQQPGTAGEGDGTELVAPLPRRKPRKIQIRSQQNQPPAGDTDSVTVPGDSAAVDVAAEVAERRRPKKLDTRSKSRTDSLKRTQSESKSRHPENRAKLDANDSGYAEEG